MAARKLPVSPDPLQPAGPRVLGSCRVSTNRQADSGISLDEQERKISKPAASSRAGPPRACLRRRRRLQLHPLARWPEGAELLAALRPGDVVIAAKMDRCFRSAFDALAGADHDRARRGRTVRAQLDQ